MICEITNAYNKNAIISERSVRENSKTMFPSKKAEQEDMVMTMKECPLRLKEKGKIIVFSKHLLNTKIWKDIFKQTPLYQCTYFLVRQLITCYTKSVVKLGLRPECHHTDR